MSEGFGFTNAGEALLYFRIIRRYRIPDDAVEIKMWLLRELVRRKKAKYIRDPKQILEGKKVLNIKHKGEQK